MKRNRGYNSKPLTFNRYAAIASASVAKESNTIHGILEVDITEPRRLINEHFQQTGEKLSLTAYIVKCLGQTISENPQLNSFIKGKNQIILDDVTICVLIEREINGEKIPEPMGIKAVQTKSYKQVNDEIREAQNIKEDRLGSLSGMTWIRFIPNFLIRTFIRIANHNIRLAKQYGKVSVTAIGMFSKDAVWFIPLGGATVLVTVGGINEKVVKIEGQFVSREHLCLTVSFDHNLVDGAPAARFIRQFTDIIKNGNLI
jgi:pyruvate/2-oxoglutarate dehydrogenase complex dihydrolipoamide acyltransferase (E2) component